MSTPTSTKENALTAGSSQGEVQPTKETIMDFNTNDSQVKTIISKLNERIRECEGDSSFAALDLRAPEGK